jgi:type I site-specific restriction endonuclease
LVGNELTMPHALKTRAYTAIKTRERHDARAKARVSIDAPLVAAGWHLCNVAHANIHAATGVAICEFPLNNGFGFADYLLYVNGKACGVIEAKKHGATLTGVELQSGRYAQGLGHGQDSRRLARTALAFAPAG